ncbi:MAG: hypothetical protein JWP18_201 [Solirubrobacterales bacterium]|jgi:hypothetical protein|nr:hypothetical protein [Solirubrobacterales bacterium]
MRLLLICLAIALVIYVATKGHVVFLPLLLFLPLGLAGRGRRRRAAPWR